SPWSFLPKSKSSKNLQQGHNQHGKDTLVESTSGNQLNSQTPLLSSSSEHRGIGRTSNVPEKYSRRTRDESKRRIASHQQKASSSCEWTSVETTSTTRRQ